MPDLYIDVHVSMTTTLSSCPLCWRTLLDLSDMFWQEKNSKVALEMSYMSVLGLHYTCGTRGAVRSLCVTERLRDVQDEELHLHGGGLA